LNILDTRYAIYHFLKFKYHTLDIRENAVEIYSPEKDTLMDRIHHTEKQQEGTTKPTGKAGPRTWEREQYIYKKEPKDDTSHGDPRLESLSQHQNDFIPFDDDGNHRYGYTAFGLGATPGLYARGELGTLAGSSRKEEQEKIMQIMRRMTTPDSNEELEADQRKLKEWSQSGGVPAEAYKKDYEMIVKAQQEYKKRAENLRKNYR
jgi:hypothetical protein